MRRIITPAAKVWLRQARLLQHLSESSYDAIIDGGASIGEFAHLVRIAKPQAPLLCVEPHPMSAAVLRRRGFNVVEAALWDHPGTIRLIQPSAAITSCTVMAEARGDDGGWTVQTRRLDDLPISGRSILLKLDLQGAEFRALAGMGEMWNRCAAILLEVSYGPNGTYEGLRALLGERGFYEAATFNELDDERGVVEADKLWLARPR